MTTLTPDQRVSLRLALALKGTGRYLAGRHAVALEALGFVEVAMTTPRMALYQITPAGEEHAKTLRKSRTKNPA